MKIKFVMFNIMLAVLLTACSVAIPINIGPRVTGSGKVITETRTVSGFDGLVVNGAGKIFIDRTGTESLVVSADDNIMALLITEVRGGKLVIEFRGNALVNNVTDLTFRMTVKNLNSIEVNGAVQLEGKNMDTERMLINVNGAADITLVGKANQLDATLSGAGKLNSENLECKQAKVANNGAGSAVVRVSDSLDATISGVGSIEYIGNPKVTQRITGIGTIRRR